MLKQQRVFDVARWEKDSEFGVFPQGARAKDAVFVPSDPPEPVLVGGKRYLFKKSKKSYPDQFWGEVIAYRVGTLLGLRVPPAFAAYNSESGQCGALIEWFYRDSSERFVLGGDFLQQVVRPGFDRDKGTQHNLQDIQTLMRALSPRSLRTDWRQWWANALLFDALIGNTDRHQDNWGLIFDELNIDEPSEISPCRLSPLFDNGTSLGHELFPDRVREWKEDRWQAYIRRGGHHVKWSLEVPDEPVKKHFNLLRKVLTEWGTGNVPQMAASIAFDSSAIRASFEDLAELPIQVPLTPGRIEIACNLLYRRHAILRELLNDFTSPHRGA